MANKVIAGTATGATALPVASTIDASADYLPIYTNNVTATQAINRNTLLNLASQPVGITDTQTLSNKTLDNTNTVNIKDTLLTLQSSADATKKLNFNLSGITTGNTRTLTVPDVSDTLVTLGATQTLTNKTLTSPTITSPIITNATISADTITGFTTSNSGTIYGIGVTTGVLTTANSIGTGTIVQNGVAASQLATTAITLGFASITTASLTNATSTPAQATGLTATVTIPAGGRKVKITAFIYSMNNSSASHSTFVNIWDGTVNSGTQLASTTIGNNSSSQAYSVTCIAVVTPASGSKTYNVGFNTDGAGTATLASGSTTPSFILVEAI
jgi:hypothetical protein